MRSKSVQPVSALADPIAQLLLPGGPGDLAAELVAAGKLVNSGALTVLLLVTGSAWRVAPELAGYPQIATGELHIAHVLWGGLLVFFVAVLMTLTLYNRWVYSVAAILAGLGMGLLVDEVGKFITQSNDYFYAPAASIIYLLFLLTVWLYMRVRRPSAREPRAVRYRVLEGLGEVLDRDLDPDERAELESRLAFVEEEA